MYILNLTYPLGVVLIFAAAFGIGYLITKKFHLNWLILWIGGAVFTLSQVSHIPFNYFGLPALARAEILPTTGILPSPDDPWSLPAHALVLGLSAGIFKETSRLLMYRFWTKSARLRTPEPEGVILPPAIPLVVQFHSYLPLWMKMRRNFTIHVLLLPMKDFLDVQFFHNKLVAIRNICRK